MDSEKRVLTQETPLLSGQAADAASLTLAAGPSDEFTHLPPNEAAILREQVITYDSNVSFFSVYRYASISDRVLIGMAMFMAAAEGSIRAVFPIVNGAFAETFTRFIQSRDFYEYFGGYYAFSMFYNSTYFNSTEYHSGSFNSTDSYNTSLPFDLSYYYDSPYYQSTYNFTEIPEYYSMEDFQRQANFDSLYFVYLGVAEFLMSYLFTFIFIDRGEILAARIRKNYLGAILKQNIAYFDKVGTGEIATRISSDTMMIQDGISEKLGYLISFLSTFTCSFIVSYGLSPRLAGYLTIVAAFIVVSFIFVSYRMTDLYKKALNGSSAGGSVIEEVLSSIRNVQAFGIQDRLSSRYDYFLSISQKYSLHAGFYAGAITGVAWLGLYICDVVAFYFGAPLILENKLSILALVTILASIIQGLFAVCAVTPHMRAVSAATGAVKKIYTTIDRVSAIDSTSDEGIILDSVKGAIELQDVKFIYPSRPDVIVMQNFNLSIKPGTTVALVGASGSGKSTIVGLIERFYKPVGGTVTFDGVDIEKLNVKWLRHQVALVSQEPVLFAGTVYDNVAHGLIGTKHEFASEIEKRALVVNACRQANAMIFIDTLPKGLDTHVGERGFLLSGGQKQRVAIARAIVSDPKILLLDEATSALDTKSEGIVQDALDKASKNRTTIVVAHRLSTIKDADKIVVMKSGIILEQGSHSELIEKRGEYYDLVMAQNVEQDVEKKLEAAEDSEDDSVEQILDEKAREIQDIEEDGGSASEEDLKETSKLILSRTKSGRSISSVVASNRIGVEEEEEKRYSFGEIAQFLFNLARPEKRINLLAIFFTIIMAAGYPYLSTVYSNSVDALGDTDEFSRNRRMRQYNITYLAMGAIEFFCPIMAVGLFSYAGQRLVRRVRMQTLRQIVRQDIAFFDKTENTAGSLTAAISKDSAAIEGLSGATLGQILNSGIMLFGAIGVSLAISLKLTAVTSPTIPVLLAAGFYRFYLLAKHQERVKAAYARSSSYASEAASSIKTVISLTREDDVIETYGNALTELYRVGRPQNNKSAMLYGAAQGIVYLIQSLMFWYGSTLVRTDRYSVFMMFTAVISIVNGSQNGSIVFSYANDMAKAYDSAGNIRRLYETEPTIDSWSDEGLSPQDVKGNIEFKNVHFRYPTRMQVPVLRGLNLTVKKGQYVALVGASGCGKSTTVGLIERFYNPLSGQILLDGMDISNLNINAYRSHIALVQQEPTLYSGTVRENVKYGSLSEVSDEKMYEACKQANIHDFIMSLPAGYETLCGAKGSLFSGGQKQRIAIARALIRDPKILLLDEATSALDNESEKIVQAALDNAAKGRTTIAIAHRLSTIQKADIIYVFENGRVLESGTHQELYANKMKYYELVKLQALEKS
ncbi:P-loop containing nucleoside triphosphate hydrolase protein [Limtongia smithiae]|uniref:P-loop containing nucleoside triphosphate hydrolase protein n=1 Tax=Limtongia smithiae TaxID=1125753 RepID=UPI0034CE5F86